MLFWKWPRLIKERKTKSKLLWKPTLHHFPYLLILICCTQVPLRGFLGSVPSDYHSYALITMVLLSAFLILMAKWASRRKPTMTRKRKKLLLDQQEFVTNVVKAKKVSAWRRKAALPLESESWFLIARANWWKE